MNVLAGRTAVITGGGSGIGRALALACAREGMRLVLADVDEAGMEETAGLAGQDSAMRLPTDVSDAKAVEALAAQAYAATGDVGILFNNAGVAAGGWIWETTPEDWAWLLGVNLMGVVHGIRAFAPRMMAQGRPGHVVNTASAAGLLTVPTASIYCASKHAVVAISECLHHELKLKSARIGVSVLCPSFVQTGIANSERHRPASLRRADGSPRRPDPNLERGMRSATLSADDIAAATMSAVKDGSFYILPHKEVVAGIRARTSHIFDGQKPHCGVLSEKQRRAE